MVARPIASWETRIPKVPSSWGLSSSLVQFSYTSHSLDWALFYTAQLNSKAQWGSLTHVEVLCGTIWVSFMTLPDLTQTFPLCLLTCPPRHTACSALQLNELLSSLAQPPFAFLEGLPSGRPGIGHLRLLAYFTCIILWGGYTKDPQLGDRLFRLRSVRELARFPQIVLYWPPSLGDCSSPADSLPCHLCQWSLALHQMYPFLSLVSLT